MMMTTTTANEAPSPTTVVMQEQPRVIPLQFPDSEVAEWTMIEVNGEILPPTDAASANDPMLELGSVHFVEEKPVMIVGSHQLTGKVETLKQPFCVLQKQKGCDGDGTEYQIKGVVTKKLLFDQYPKTLIRRS